MSETTGSLRNLARSKSLLPASLVVVVAASVVGFGVSAQASVVPASKASAKLPCAALVVDGVIPVWARAGFTERKPRMNYEISAKGDIAALLFSYPLLSPASITHHNKILWVSRLSANGSTLIIHAHRMKGAVPIGQLVRRQVKGGPGLSIINLPAAGCWQLSLSWSGHHDVIDLNYAANSSAY